MIFRRPLVSSSIIVLLTLTTATSAAVADDASPNIVYVIADDLGYGDVHCLNPDRGKISTPNLDRLASEGMTFTDAHGGSSVCTPTRYGVLTGRYAWRTRLQHGVLDGNLEPLIAPDRLTVARLLQNHGYHTAAIGKWHLGFTVNSKGKATPIGARTLDGPITRGFDEFLGFQHARSMSAFFHQDRVVEKVEPIDMLPKLADLAATHVKERARDGQPFFLYLALSSPHTPIVPSAAWQGKSGLGDYADFVMETDWAVGEVLNALDESKISTKTLVFFTSDNGCSPAAGVRQLESQGHFPSAQFRGYKSDIWDGGHRVPFFVRWPNRVKAGAINNSLTCLTDLLATAAELLEAPLPDAAGEDSVSMLGQLLGTGRPARSEIVHHSIDGRFAVRDGATKLALCSGSGGWGKETTEGDVQLYDLSTDIGERTNLAPSRPDEVRRLREKLAQIVAGGRSTPGKSQSNDVAVQVMPARVSKKKGASK